MGNTAHVLAADNVLYVPKLGLQILEGGVIPDEGIVDPWNLRWLKLDESDFAALSSRYPSNYCAEEVCILSNVFSTNFSHFTEELLKVLILERARYSGPYIYTELPKFAFEFWDALGLDRRRLHASSV